ncbi:BamA/TamA family outer membrane protein [Curvibacter sp. RS43]|uniref:autotransporter assembly complex protein TamA n=1 Tax=Curvibacter microcysteis TaxID=3026419 RepID=UPI00235E1206|nr:BamA/TamA family outer membrane protein [Curvibacter sp. RS43]MDD0812311.1 BamA/TamA family outer membrane protein [Curvibacter sp. RS43]
MFGFRRGKPAHTPAFLWLLWLALFTLGNAWAADPRPATAPAAFDLQVQAPDALREHLMRHLELLQYRELQDLDREELDRLLGSAHDNALELLATQGYFSATVELSVQDPGPPEALAAAASTPSTTDASAKPQQPGPRWTVLLKVQPGEPVRISRFSLQLQGEILNSNALAAQQKDLEDSWALRPGTLFTQAAWDQAKTEALRRLTANRFPTGHLLRSEAAIDTDLHEAVLSLTLDSGPDYRFGDIVVEGTRLHDPELVRRLAQIPPGTVYTQTRLLEAQQRVADSGYFDSVFMSLDTQGDPQNATVRVQVREAKLHKWVLGIGASTDSGARLSSEYTHRKLPWLDWRAVSKLSLDRETKTLGTELTGQPDTDNWRATTSAQLQRQLGGSAPVNSLMLRAGRSKTEERYDRNLFLQYDHAITQSSPPENASSVSANYAWTRRNFNTLPFPTQGFGLAVELGAGLTLGAQREPYLRSRARILGFLPIGVSPERSLASTPRLAWRAEGGAIGARSNVVLPSTQRFLTGGDTTVRGYGYREIGVVQADGSLSAGRYLAVGSLEWQQPLRSQGRTTAWDAAVFVDAGAVANQASELKAKVGLGVGARWRSPVGPLALDLAWGAATHRWRLHMNLGFSF